MTAKEFITRNRLTEFQLLKDFVARGLKPPALVSCDEAIASCKTKILALKTLKKLIEEEGE